MTTTERTYSRTELRDPTARPRVRTGATYRVEAPVSGQGDSAAYNVPTPCCGTVTRVPVDVVQWYTTQHDAGHRTWIECGKPWSYRRGNPRGAGCRARYALTPAEPTDTGTPTVELTWTGR